MVIPLVGACMWCVTLPNYCRLCSKCCRGLLLGGCPAAVWDPSSHWSRVWDWLQKYVLVGSQKYSLLCVICRLLVFAEWIRGARRGRDSKWITLPLNKQGGGEREDVCFRKSQDRTREACFLCPLFKQPYSCCKSPLHSGSFRGDSISILVPSFALPINSFLPCVGPLVSFFLFYKVSKNGDLVPLICILNSRSSKKSEENGSFCEKTGRLKGIRASIHVSEWHLVTKMQYSLYGVSRWSCLSSRRLCSELLSAQLPPSHLIPGDTDTMCTVKQNLWLKVMDDSPTRNEFLHSSRLFFFFEERGGLPSRLTALWNVTSMGPGWQNEESEQRSV